MKKCWYSRLLSLILAAALILPLAVPVRVAAATGGTFGSGLSWELEDGCPLNSVTIPAPASVLEQADDVRVFLLDHETLQPLCRYGS